MQFLRSLARNNKRDWFQPRKHLYEEHVKAPMTALVEALNRALGDFAPEYVTDPKQAIYRIYRDTRFSPDKTPYKTHIAASFPRRGSRKHGEGGYYVAISAKSVDVGGGIYEPQPDTLRAIRNHIAAHHEELRAILNSAAVKRLLGQLWGDQLTRVPKGFFAGDPAADLIRYKHYILYVSLPADLATSPRLYTEIVKRFQAMTPFIQYLSRPLVRPKQKPVARFDDSFRPVNF